MVGLCGLLWFCLICVGVCCMTWLLVLSCVVLVEVFMDSVVLVWYIVCMIDIDVLVCSEVDLLCINCCFYEVLWFDVWLIVLDCFNIWLLFGIFVGEVWYWLEVVLGLCLCLLLVDICFVDMSYVVLCGLYC